MCFLFLLFPRHIFRILFYFWFITFPGPRAVIPGFNSLRDDTLTRLSHSIWFQFQSRRGDSPAAPVINMGHVGMHNHFSGEFKQKGDKYLVEKKKKNWDIITSGASSVILYFFSWVISSLMNNEQMHTDQQCKSASSNDRPRWSLCYRCSVSVNDIL